MWNRLSKVSKWVFPYQRTIFREEHRPCILRKYFATTLMPQETTPIQTRFAPNSGLLVDFFDLFLETFFRDLQQYYPQFGALLTWIFNAWVCVFILVQLEFHILTSSSPTLICSQLEQLTNCWNWRMHQSRSLNLLSKWPLNHMPVTQVARKRPRNP